MINIKKILFGTNSKQKLKKYSAIVGKINDLGPTFQNYSEEDFKAKTNELRDRVSGGESLDDILPEAFALVRQAADNVLGERHYDVQLIGGMALHDGQVAEMKTGEGKTLTSTLPVYLNALTQKGVILVTVNDYLASRDAEWMGKVFNYLGMSVGLVLHEHSDEERKASYACDITYCTNSELGFDYLRDNMKYNEEYLVQRSFYFAIVDEVDSILIDEARTPLIISGPSEESTEKYSVINSAVRGLKRAYRVGDNPDADKVKDLPEKLGGFDELNTSVKESRIVIPGDYVLDEKTKNIQLTDEGVELIESRIGELLEGKSLYEAQNMVYLHHVQQALKAWYVFRREIDYLVQDGAVILVDEFTGRLMQGRRYSDGLHQALEAKEGLKVEKENQTLASITYQNLFRKFDKLAGMTGTAETEEEEFLKIYKLGVVVIPTNRKIARKDHTDSIYKTKHVKNKAIVEHVKALYEKGQPVLVGTDSIEYSEELSSYLHKAKVPHSVLNAKYFEKEAEIVANAGRKKTVTIATNMAGRGTDIKIDDEVRAIGGLFILGAVRHESRRIDNQLRGRSGRQGDPGESKFIISLEDDLLRVFGGERISKIMTTLKIDESEAIEHPLISRAIENSQKTVESRNFSVRKHLLEYDDVLNTHREIIYSRRKQILQNNFGEMLREMVLEHGEVIIDTFLPPETAEEWNIVGLSNELERYLGGVPKILTETGTDNNIQRKILDEINNCYDRKQEEFGELAEKVEQRILLQATDLYWREHYLNMDMLKESVSLSGYAQKNPLDEYKKGSYELFQVMHNKTIEYCFQTFFSIRLISKDVEFEQKKLRDEKLKYNSEDDAPTNATKPKQKKPFQAGQKIGRNDKCYCGSGKKYKSCCYLKDFNQA